MMSYRRILANWLLLVAAGIFITLNTSRQAHAQIFPGCDMPSNFDLIGPPGGTQSTNANFNQGDVLTALLQGPVINSFLQVDGNTLFNTDTSGSASYTFPSNGTFSIVRDLQGLGGSMIFSCTPAAGSSATNGNSAAMPPEYQFQRATDWSLGIIQQSVGTVFGEDFYWRQAKGLLLDGVKPEAPEDNALFPPEFGLKHNYDGFFVRNTEFDQKLIDIKIRRLREIEEAIPIFNEDIKDISENAKKVSMSKYF